jgi:hypothetical protein
MATAAFWAIRPFRTLARTARSNLAGSHIDALPGKIGISAGMFRPANY